MSAFTDWLGLTDVSRVLLLDAKVYSGGAEITRYLSSRSFYTGSADTPTNAQYDNRITGDPIYTRTMKAANIGYIEIDNSDAALDGWINDSWAGREAILRLGDANWNISQFGIIYTGTIKRIEVTDTTIRLILQESHKTLDVPVQPNLYTSGTNDKKEIPLTYGTCTNITPMFDGTTYQVNDGSMTDVCAYLYVDGALDTTTTVTKNNAAGTFTISPAASGKVTCKSISATSLPGDIITAMVAQSGAGITVNAASVTALNVALPYSMGIYIKKRTNLQTAIDSLLPLDWWFRFNRDGELELGVKAEPGTSVLDITDIETQGDIKIAIKSPPHWRMRLNFDKNFTKTSTGANQTIVDRNEMDFFSVVETSDATVKTQYLSALDPEPYPAMINSTADASTELLRLFTLGKIQRYIYHVTCYMMPFSLNIGDTITLTDARYQHNKTKMIVQGMVEHFLTNEVGLTLWR